MQTKNVIILGVLIVAFISGSASASIIVDQLPAQLGGYGSDTEIRDINGEIVWYREADNVRVSQSALVRNLKFFGFYGSEWQNHLPPSGDETIRIRFYGARTGDGLPDSNSVLFDHSYLNPTRVETGKTIAVSGAPDEYLFDVDLGVGMLLLADTTYWLEVVQVGDPESTFRWETGFGAVSGHAVINYSIPDWVASSGSFAFQLSTVPEPSTIGLIFVGTGCVTSRYRVRRRMPGE